MILTAFLFIPSPWLLFLGLAPMLESIDNNYIYFIGGILLTISVLVSRLSSAIGTPILLVFLALGMLTGQDGLIIHIVYNDYTSAFFISNLMLALIILDGGLRTNIHTLRSVAKESFLLASVGVLVTSAITGGIAYLFLDLKLMEALLIGAIVGSTDAAAVFSLLGGSGVNLKEKISSTLQIESATNDPMAILLTVVLLSYASGEASTPLAILSIFVLQFGLGAIGGLIFGLFGRIVVATANVGPGLYALLTIGIGLSGFAITAALGGSGFLAIFIIGVLIGNQKIRPVSYILPVGEGITWLSQITLFLLLGLLVTPHQMVSYWHYGVVVALILTFVARPAAVFLCMKPFFKRYSNRELIFISWVGLRGSVPIVLAIYPVMSGLPNAQLYFNVAFIVVLFSLLVQGASIVLSAKVMHITAPASAAPINKSEMGISMSDDYELYSYNVKLRSLDGVSLREIRFPKRTQIAALYRDGHMLKTHGDTKLQHDDIISVIGHENDEPLLNAIFSQDKRPKPPARYQGDIILNGSEKMVELKKTYDLELTSFESGLTLSEFMDYHIGGFPQVGDALSLINVKLTVAELQGDRVSRVGLTQI